MNDNRTPVRAWEIVVLLIASAILASLILLPYVALEMQL